MHTDPANRSQLMKIITKTDHLRAFCQAFLFKVYRLDRRLRQLHIHADAAVIDLLVTMP